VKIGNGGAAQFADELLGYGRHNFGVVIVIHTMISRTDACRFR
jgi:hypothetical protein